MDPLKGRRRGMGGKVCRREGNDGVVSCTVRGGYGNERLG